MATYPIYAKQWLLLKNDLVASLKLWRLWTHLGWGDLLKQYRRSFLGPVWISLNTAVFIVLFSLIAAQLFKQSMETYLAYFCVGHVVFSFFSALVSEGCQTYISSEAFLKQTPYPKLAFVLRVVWRNVLTLGHNLPIVLAVLAWTGQLWAVRLPWLMLGLLLTLLAGALVVAILGALAARFRDIPMIVSSLMQISFFITPVMWQSNQLTERAQLLVVWNPLAAYLDLLRMPLLGTAPRSDAITLACATLVVLAGIFVLLYLNVRRRIVYWL